MNSVPIALRDFTFRAMIFDAECERFRAAGIHVGIPSDLVERDLMRDALSPFGISLRDPALRMARLYAVLHCFENSVRELVSSRLSEKAGLAWWDSRVPTSVRKSADSRKKDAEANSWLEGSSPSILQFVDFGNLCDIIVNNWSDFTDLIPTQHWLKQRFDELEKCRNFIAHNRNLLETEFDRIEMYINDWSKQVGF